MTKWFVFVGPTYYPYGEIVEADTAEAAGRAAGASDYESGVPVLVFPLDALAHERGERDGLTDWTNSTA